MTKLQPHTVGNLTIHGVFKYMMLLFVILFVLAQKGICLPGETSQPREKNLKVFFIPYISFMPLVIADEEGYYSEQGLKVEFMKLSRSAQAIPALTQGGLDVLAGTTSFSLFNAMARGARIKIVADKGYVAPSGCTDLAIMVRKDWAVGLKSLSAAQLKGRRIAVTPVASAGFLAEKALQTVGLTLEDVQIIDLPDPVKLEAFGTKRIDLAYANEPWVTRISRTGHAVPWISASQVIPDFQNAFIMYGPSLLDRSPDVGKRFMVAYRKAVLKYNEGKTDRNLDIIAKHTGLDGELLRQASWPTFRESGRISARSVLEFQDWGRKKGFLDMIVAEEQFWDPSFVDYSNAVLRGASK